MSEYSYTKNEMGEKPKDLTIKEVNRMYIDRIIQSLTEDKEKWTREVMCGMDGCFVDYYSPEYINNSGEKITFSDKELAGAHINSIFAWSISFWDYYNPFSDRASKLRKAMSEMRLYLIEKETQKRLKSLKKTIE